MLSLRTNSNKALFFKFVVHWTAKKKQCANRKIAYLAKYTLEKEKEVFLGSHQMLVKEKWY